METGPADVPFRTDADLLEYKERKNFSFTELHGTSHFWVVLRQGGTFYGLTNNESSEFWSETNNSTFYLRCFISCGNIQLEARMIIPWKYFLKLTILIRINSYV